MSREGRARPVGVSVPEGVAVLPGVPPIAEALPGFRTAVWHGIVAPAGMEPALAARINEVFGRIAAMPEVAAAVATNQAGTMVGGPPEAFGAHLRAEVARWRPIIRDGNIRAT
jgi:tripartite-type tricarboxylate transporter receptor subunit TctC